jgi:hypothetical protein
MRLPLCLAALLMMQACSPSLNWREIRLDPLPVWAHMPCKPDRGTRTIALAGVVLELQMVGCATDGATFALMAAPVPDPGRAGVMLDAWKQGTLQHMKASETRESAFAPPGALGIPQSLRVQARGAGPTGAVVADAVWTARVSDQGVTLVHAVIYRPTANPEVAEAFFGGLRLP